MRRRGRDGADGGGVRRPRLAGQRHRRFQHRRDPDANARCAGRRAEVRGVPRAEAQVRGIGAASPASSLSSGLR